MSKEFPCPHCKQKIQLLDTRRPLVTCPHCSKNFAIKQAVQSGEAKRIGDYELIKKLGGGQMGTVYKARHASGKVVALKLLNSTLAGSESFIKRFQREAEASKTFDHPYLVKAFDHGEADGYQYYAMEFIDGEDLEVKLRRGETLDEGQSLYVAKCVAEGLRFAWGMTIVHRDIKPANIMIESDGRIRLMDMGLAKDVSDASATVTQAGGVLGSPAYAAPEQLGGDVNVDIRADIYALGTTLFHLACGVKPFTGETAGVIAANNMALPLPDPREFKAELSEPFCVFLKKLTEKQPENRFQTPAEVLEAIEKVLMGEMPTKISALLPTRKIDREKGVTSRKSKNKLAVPAVIVAVLGLGALGLVIYSKSRPNKTPALRIYRRAAETKQPESKAPTRKRSLLGAQYATVEDIGIEDLYHVPLKVEGGVATITWDFSRSEQLQDWGYRGQARGPLFCTPAGTGPVGAYLAKGLRLEAEVTLLMGTVLNLALQGKQDITLHLASPEGSYLSLKKGHNEFVTSDKKASVAAHTKTKFTLEITGAGVKAQIGAEQFEIQGEIEGDYVIRIEVEQKVGSAVLERFETSGLPSPEWANAAMSRVFNQELISKSLDNLGRGGNQVFAVTAGTTITLPDDFHALSRWTLEAYVFLYRMSVSPSSPLVLLGKKDGHRIALSGSNRIVVHLKEENKKPESITSQNALSRGRWHHVAITKDGVNLEIFLDGQLEMSTQVPPEYGQLTPGEYYAGLEEGGDPSAISFIDDYTITNTVIYQTSFNPRPPSIAGASTWLLFEFLEGAGIVARNTARANADGQVMGGAWINSLLPGSHYEKIQKVLEDRARTWIELQHHDKWQSTGIMMRKGQILSIVKMTYFKQIDLDAGAADRSPLGSEALLNAKINDGKETLIDVINQEFEAPETGILNLRNAGTPKDILVQVVIE